MAAARIVAVTAEIFHTPLHDPFVTSRGAATTATAVAVRLTLDNGVEARGEAVPVTYVTDETPDTVANTVHRLAPQLVGADPARYRRLLDTISRLAPNAPSARCALEMAVLDAWSQVTDQPLVGMLGAARDSIETDITIPIVPNAAELAARAWRSGMRIFKLKVGEKDLEADHARVRAVREAAPEARLRLDANQAFTADGALAFVERLLAEGAHIELLEQPTPKNDIEALARVAERSPVPVFADESVRTPADALHLAATTGVQGFNLKINKNGIAGVLDIIPIVRAANRRLMLGCMLETRRSIAVSLAIACGTGAFDFLDLDSHLLLNEEGDNPHFHQDAARLILNRS